MRSLNVVFLSLMFTSSLPAKPTAYVAYRLHNEVYIAADSKVTASSGRAYPPVCKLGHRGTFTWMITDRQRDSLVVDGKAFSWDAEKRAEEISSRVVNPVDRINALYFDALESAQRLAALTEKKPLKASWVTGTAFLWQDEKGFWVSSYTVMLSLQHKVTHRIEIANQLRDQESIAFGADLGTGVINMAVSKDYLVLHPLEFVRYQLDADSRAFPNFVGGPYAIAKISQGRWTLVQSGACKA